MKKSKLALALLAGTVLAVSVSGITACGEKEPPKPESDVVLNFVAVTKTAWDADTTFASIVNEKDYNLTYKLSLDLNKDKTLKVTGTCKSGSEKQQGGGNQGGGSGGPGGPGGGQEGPGGGQEGPGGGQEGPGGGQEGPGGNQEGPGNEQTPPQGAPAALAETSGDTTDWTAYNFTMSGTWSEQTGWGYTVVIGGTTIKVDYDTTQGRHTFYWYAAPTINNKKADEVLVQMQAQDSAYRKTLASDYKTYHVKESKYVMYGFNDNGGNIMAEGYLPDQTIELSEDIFPKDFLSFVNEYADTVSERGAKTYFSFPPMNRFAVEDDSADTLEAFYTYLGNVLHYKVISNAEKYVMDAEWFYDTNYHLNAAGMTARSIYLLEDIKNELGIFTPTKTEMPEKPPLQAPENPDDGEGDNGFADCFEYADDGNGGWMITALTEKGKNSELLVVPYTVEGKKVALISAEVFAGNEKIREVVIQNNIRYLRDGSFSGCKNLEKIVLRHTAPSEIGVSYRLLENTEAMIFVKKSAFSAFCTDYTWGWYTERLVSYEA